MRLHAASRRLSKLRRLLIGTLIGLTALQPVMQAASSLPTGGTFAAGSGNIAASGNTLTINQSSLRGIIDWNTFSIGKGAAVSFKNGSGATLNRVNGGPATSILGQLLATGNVYLINPEGILIGHGATIHTGGDFLASTLNLSNSAFLNGGPLTFTGSSPATVVNLGDLTSTGGGVYLIGHSVRNAGSINTPNGTTGLAAGSQVLITDSSTDQKVAVQAPGGDVTNSGFIHAAQAELKSNGGNIYALAGNNGGQINATGTATQDGHVWLVATNGTTNVSGLISANNANGTGGSIETSGAHVVTKGAQLKTGKGGNWLLDPDDLTIDSSLAGTIETSLNGGTNVTEQTTDSGTGGSGDITVASNIAWSTGADLTLSAYRNIGINNGVSISNTGAGNLTLRADNASTGTGTITFTGTGKVDFSGSTGNISLLYNPSSYATPTDYSSNVLTNGSWTAPSDGSVTSQMTAYMLVNSAANLQNIDINDAGAYALGQNIDTSSIANFTPLASTGSGFTGILDGQNHTIANLTINASDGNAGLFDTVGPAGQIRNLNLANAGITVFGSVGMVGTLAGVSNGGTFGNVSASGVVHAPTGNEIGGLIGEIEGGTLVQGSHSDVTIDAALDSTGVGAGGLVGAALSTADVINNSYATGPIAAGTGMTVGGLVGYSPGAVSNSYATGSLTGGANMEMGGLEGYASGPVTNSRATGSVTAGANSYVGGLAGLTLSSGPISNSYATGSVTAGDNSYAGGLAAAGNAAISNSYTTGSVTAGANSYVGGLMGLDETAITTSYALGSVTAGGGSNVGGLAGYIDAPVTDSYARGSVTATSGVNSYIGGLVGFLQGASIATSYSSGAVTAGSGATAGGLIGLNVTSTITSSYWDNQTSGFPTVGVGSGSSAGVTGQTTAQLQSGTLPTGFSSSTWTTPAGLYPYLSWQGPLVAISGTAYNDSSAIGSANVNALSAGYLLGTAATNSSGFYTLSEPSNMVASGVLTYLASGGIANTFSNGTGGFTGMNLHTGMLNVINGTNQTLSGIDAALNFALGSNTGSNFLFAVTSGQLNLSSAANLSLASSASALTLDQSIVGTGDILINSAGSLSIANGQALTAGSGITLVTGGAFSNNAGANALNVSGAGIWLVYSQNPANDTIGGLPAVFKQYNAAYGVATPAQAGNGLLYILAPIVTATLTGTATKTYDGTDTAALASGNFSSTGAASGDTVTLTTPTGGTYSNPNVNTGIGVTATGISIDSVSSAGIPVYGYQLASGTASGNIGTINPATLIYTANSGSRTYGSSNPAFSGTVTGFVNNETLSSATTGTVAFASSATSVSNQGTYAIDGSGLTANNSNYTFAQAALNSSALTINPALLTYTASPTSRTYGVSNSTFTGSITGFVLGQTLSSATTGIAAFTSSATSSSNVGTYAIIGSGLTANNGNYTFAQAASNSSALTIDSAVLTLAVNNTARLQNQANPTFMATYNGPAVNGLNVSSLLAGLTFQTTASTSSSAGTYQITASAIAPPGYILNIVPGTLTVIDNSPRTIPSQITTPTLPILLPASANGLLQPDNATGVFQIGGCPANQGFGSSQTPLAQSFFCAGSADSKAGYFSRAKP